MWDVRHLLGKLAFMCCGYSQLMRVNKLKITVSNQLSWDCQSMILCVIHISPCVRAPQLCVRQYCLIVYLPVGLQQRKSDRWSLLGNHHDSLVDDSSTFNQVPWVDLHRYTPTCITCSVFLLYALAFTTSGKWPLCSTFTCVQTAVS